MSPVVLSSGYEEGLDDQGASFGGELLTGVDHDRGPGSQVKIGVIQKTSESSILGREHRVGAAGVARPHTGHLGRSGVVWAQPNLSPTQRPQQSTSLDALRQGTSGNSHSHTFRAPNTCCGCGSRAAPPCGLSWPFRSDSWQWLQAEMAVLGCPLRKKKVSKSMVYESTLLPSYSTEKFGRQR